MIFRKRIVIADNERALVFRDRQLTEVLATGVHYITDVLGRTKVNIFDVTDPEVKNIKIKSLMRSKAELCKQYFQEVSTDETEIALIYLDGKFASLMAPQSDKVFWKTIKIDVTKIDISSDIQASDKLITLLAKSAQSSVLSKGLMIKEIVNKQVGLLFIDGKFVKVLTAGKYGFWNYSKTVTIEIVETRAQSIDVSGQEILTKDKVSLRVNLAASFKVADAKIAISSLSNYKEFLYTELQLALRKSIGTQTLDALLTDKEPIDAFVRKNVSKKVSEFGLSLLDVGVKDIILPGEMKTILNQVVEAEKAAKANIIKRREETAATRSLLNTAKLMDESATLRRLKELETLEKIAEKVDKITVFGGLEGVIQDTIKISV
ncbi:MAG: slipin family protein [Proteobacteria bacterium]|nr:slipin family protein [Pseudomonadota bacterium]